MPELPEVETVVRDLRPQIVGRSIARVARATPSMAQTTLGSFRRLLLGQRVQQLDRHGKWMFFLLGGGNTLVVHLGMTGRLGVVAADETVSRHTHLRLVLDAGDQEVRFADSRKFGKLLVIDPQQRAEDFGPGRLGPDATRIRPQQLIDGLQKTRRTVKAALLDQRLVAGIGNIYADEILFDAGICPGTKGVDLGTTQIERICRSTKKILRRAIRRNGTSIRDYVTGRGVPGEFQRQLKVYGRANLPCKKCSAPIELSRAVVSGRATCWCPVCQTPQ